MGSKKLKRADAGSVRKGPPGVGKDKNRGGQSYGQFEHDSKHGTGQYQQAGEPPIMKK